MINIIYRTCEKINPTNGSRPIWCQEADFKYKCLKSLASGLIKNEYRFIVIGDCLSDDTILKIKEIIPDAEIKNFDEKLGNQQSLLQSYLAADSFSDENGVLFFCEDDYLFLPNWMRNMKYFFENVAKKFQYSFYHPTDYPDQYREDRTRKSYIYLNGNGGWFREVDSTTCTKACSVKTYRKYSELLKDCAVRKKIGYNQKAEPIYNNVGADDGRLSEIFGHKNNAGYISLKQEAVCFSPIPGDSAHTHEGTMSYFINWQNIYSKIK